MELSFKIAKPGKGVAIRSDSGEKRSKPTWTQLEEKENSIPLDILGVPYGGHIEGRDEDGEAFYKDTDIVLNPGDVIPLTYYHGFGPDDPFDMQNPPEIIGLAKYSEETAQGHRFEALVDPETPLGARIKKALEDAADVKASSGAVQHLIRMGKGGLIDYWPVAELAIFDTNDWRKPANQFATVQRKGETKSPPCRQAGETLPECISRKVAEIGRENPDWDQDRVLAVAYSMCDKSCEEAGAAEALGEVAGATNQESKDAGCPCRDETQTKNQKIRGKRMNPEEKNNETPETETQEPLFTLEQLQEVVQAAVKAEVEELKASLTPNAPAALVNGAPAYVKSENLGDKEEYGLARYVKDGWLPKAQKAALQEGTTTEGGYLVPDDELREIIAKRDEVSIPRAMGARTFTTNRDMFNVPVEDGSLSKFTIVAEEGAISTAEEEPTFAQVTIPIYKMMKLIKVSEELLEDDNAGLEAFLSDCIGRAWADTENYYALVGSGSGQPEGVFVGGTAGLTTASATAITPGEVIALKYKLSQPYRTDNTSWVMHGDTEAYLRALENSATEFVFAPWPRGTGNRNLESMEGYPVFNNSNVATIASTAKTICFGNWGYYALVTNRSLRIRRLMELYAGNGQVGILASVRFGGAVLLAEAFQYMTQAT